MNALTRWILRLCAILGVLLTSACIDVSEEFWIKKDGSAEAEIICTMPRTATLAVGGTKGIQSMAEDLLAADPKIDAYRVEVKTEERRVSLKIHIEVGELMRLDDLRKSIQRDENLPPAVREMVGVFEIGIEGLTAVSVARTVAPGKAVPALKLIPKAQLQQHRLTKVMHFPRPVISHNAHEVSEDGRTLRWESSLASAVKTPLIYEFVMPLPIPWGWIWAGIAALAALVISLVLLMRRKKSGRPKASADEELLES